MKAFCGGSMMLIDDTGVRDGGVFDQGCWREWSMVLVDEVREKDGKDDDGLDRKYFAGKDE